jgi:hypothetical protein
VIRAGSSSLSSASPAPSPGPALRQFLDRPIQNEFAGLATWGAAIGGSLVLLIAYRLLFGNSRERR